MFSAICGICGPRTRLSIFGKRADPVLDNQDIFGADAPRLAANGGNQVRLRGDGAAAAPPPQPYFAGEGDVTLQGFDERNPIRQASFGAESHDSIDTEYDEDVAKCRAELTQHLIKENSKFQEQAASLSSLTRAMTQTIDKEANEGGVEPTPQQTRDMEKKMQELEQSRQMAKHMDVLTDQFKGEAPKGVCRTASGVCLKVPEPPKAPRNPRKGKKPKIKQLAEDEDGEDFAPDNDPVEKDYQGIQEKLRTIEKILEVEGPVPRADAATGGRFQAAVSRQRVQDELLETADRYRDVMEGKYHRLGFDQDDIDEDHVDPADPAKAVKSAIAQYQQVSLERGIFYPMPGGASGDGLSSHQERELRTNMHQLREDRTSDMVWRRSIPEDSRRDKRLGAAAVAPADEQDPVKSRPTVHAKVDVSSIEALLGMNRHHNGNAGLVGV